MAVHVVPGLGVAVYRFRGIPILTPRRLDRSTGRLARALNLWRITTSEKILLEDIAGAKGEGMTIVEFLSARLDEDETELGQLIDRDEPAGPNGIGWAEVGAISEVLIIGHRRALAECEAKRRIVEEHLPGVAPSGPYCGCCWLEDLNSWEPHPCPTLRALALPYSDHPDYLEEWKP